MKGSIEEMFYFIAVFFAVFILFVFLTYQRGIRGVEVRKKVEERILIEEVSSLVSTLFSNKLPITEKYYLESGIDAILQGKAKGLELYKVFYGDSVGLLNVTEIIPSYLDKYVKGRWELRMITPDGEYTYGEVKRENVVYVYEALIPVPEERTGKIVFLLGRT